MSGALSDDSAGQEFLSGALQPLGPDVDGLREIEALRDSFGPGKPLENSALEKLRPLANSGEFPQLSDSLELALPLDPKKEHSQRHSPCNNAAHGISLAQSAVSSGVQNISEKRIIGMNDRIWEKVLQMAEDVQQLQTGAQLSATSASDTKDDIHDLYKQLANLQTQQDEIRADSAEQYQRLGSLDAAQGETTIEVKDILEESLKKISVKIAMTDENLENLRSNHEKTSASIEEVAKVVDGLTDIPRQFDILEQALTEFREDFEKKKAHTDQVMEVIGQETKRLEQESKRLEQETKRLEPRLAKCEETLVNQEDLLQTLDRWRGDVDQRLQRCEGEARKTQAIQHALDSLQDKLEPGLLRCKEEVPKLQDQMLSVKQQQDAMQTAITYLDEIANALKKDLVANRTAANEAMGSLTDRQSNFEVKTEAHRKELDEFKAKSDKRADELTTMMEQALPPVIRRAQSLADSMTSIESRITDMSAKFDQEVRRVGADLVEGLKMERSRTSSALAVSLERCQAEAAPRFDTLDHRCGAFERQCTTLDQRFALCEQQWKVQDSRISSHDEVLRQLSARCQEIPCVLEARLNEVRSAAKEDLAATTLTALQGEMRLMAKVAQLSGQCGQTMQTAVPSYALGGQAWQPHVAAHAPSVGHMLLPGMPSSLI